VLPVDDEELCVEKRVSISRGMVVRGWVPVVGIRWLRRSAGELMIIMPRYVADQYYIL